MMIFRDWISVFWCFAPTFVKKFVLIRSRHVSTHACKAVDYTYQSWLEFRGTLDNHYMLQMKMKWLNDTTSSSIGSVIQTQNLILFHLTNHMFYWLIIYIFSDKTTKMSNLELTYSYKTIFLTIYQQNNYKLRNFVN